MLYQRILNAENLTTGSAQDLSTASDLGDYIRLHLLARVSQPATGTGTGAASGPVLTFQHAPCNEEDAYVDFDPPLTIDLSVAGATWAHRDDFMRFLRWTTSGEFETDAVASVDLVAKT